MHVNNKPKKDPYFKSTADMHMFEETFEHKAVTVSKHTLSNISSPCRSAELASSANDVFYGD